MKRLIVSGSPRGRGRSAALVDALHSAYKQTFPDDDIEIISLSDLRIVPCTGCGACEHKVPGRDELYCVFADDMVYVRTQLNSCGHLSIVSPVYFAGVPSQLKALLDRLQPYYWTDYRSREKRSCDLYVVGDGGDPHGFGPLVGSVRSALAVAGLNLETVHDWVGLIKEDGSIAGQADVLTAGRVHAAEEYTCSGPHGTYPTYQT